VKLTLGAPETDAVSVFAPAVVPRRQFTFAAPLALVVTLTLALKAPPLLTAPPPVATVKVTCAFGTALLLASLTTTLGAVVTGVFTVAD
jgi:hypothetical protein